MKLTNAIALLSVAVAGILPLSAQQAAPSPMLQAYAQVKNAKGNKLNALRLVPPSSVEKGVVAIYANPDQPPTEMRTKDFKFLMVLTPEDLAAATRSFAAGNLKDARRQLAAVRAKYTPFIGLPDSPALKAARMELECCVRMMNWEAVGKLVASSPDPAFLPPEDRVELAAARLLSQVSDDAGTAAERQKAIESFLGDSKSKTLNSEVYCWLKYALGRALASKIPAAELQNGIAASHEEAASLAVDAYCEAFASNHGRNAEIPVDALKRAFQILWAMPGVKQYALSVKQMNEKTWNDAPYNFRDAVALAYILENVAAPGLKDSNIQKAASLHFNRLQGKKAAGK